MSTPTRRRFVLTGLAALTLSAAPLSTARAAEVTVTASLGNDRVQVGDGVYLRVEIETTGGVIGEPRFPELEDVDVQSRGSSSGTSVSIINGRADRRSTKTYTYVLAPRKAGSFTIPVEVEVDGKVHRPAIAPKLIATGEAPAAAVDSGEAVSESPQSADSEVIVWPVVNQSTAYVGEQLIYELQVWDRSRGNLQVSSLPTFKDFWSVDLELPRSRMLPRRVIDGVPYQIHRTMRRALFPQKVGTLTIGGPKVQLQRVVSFFGRGGGPPRSFQGRSLAIEVLPLPAEGQPPGFKANNVGQLELSAEADREAIVQGEAVRLTVTISGTGNIPLIEPAAWPEVPGMRSYEPKAEEPVLTTTGERLSGSREYTMLLVAEQAGRVEIPAIELPYFDPEAEAYAVARSEPITLEVAANPDAKPAEDGDEQGRDEGEAGDEDRELLAEPVAGDSLVRVTPRARWLTPKRWWIGTLAPPALLGLSWLGLRLARRFGPDEATRQRGEARQRRRILLAEASEALESGENFYPKLASLLHSAAIHRAGEDGVGLAREPLMKLLRERGAEAEEVQILRELLDACDMARFGAGSGDAATRGEHLERARELLGRSSWRIR